MEPMKRLRQADLHLHSHASHDVPGVARLSPRALFEKALGERRLDYFALTDHDTMAGWAELVRELPEADRNLVIPAVEHTLLDPELGFTIHVNLFLLDPDQYEQIRREVVTLDDLFEFCVPRGIHMQYNHPTWFEPVEWRAGKVDFAKVRATAARFQVLELNAGRPERLNEMTLALAYELDRVLVSNSDSHSGDVGLSRNYASGDCARDFLANLWLGRGTISPSDMTYDGMLAVVYEMIDNILDERGQRVVGDDVLHHQPLLVRIVVGHLANSRRLRRGPARAVVRHVLRQVSRPAIGRWFDHEHELARRLSADLTAI